jgi:hypothetical protein
MKALAERRPPGGPDGISLDTRVMALVDQHIGWLAEDGRLAPSTPTATTQPSSRSSSAACGWGSRSPPGSTRRCVHAQRARPDDGAPCRHTPARCASARSAEQRAGKQPDRDVQTIRSKSAPKGAQALTAEQLRELLIRIRASETCERRDLADPITLLIATGPRRSELLALRWSDFDPAAGTVAVCGKVVRQSGKGLFRVDETKREPRPRQPRRTLAPTARRVGRAGRQLAQPPQVAGNADRRHRPDTSAWPRQGSAEATVKHQPKHCRPSAEAEMSAISRRNTP